LVTVRKTLQGLVVVLLLLLLPLVEAAAWQLRFWFLLQRIARVRHLPSSEGKGEMWCVVGARSGMWRTQLLRCIFAKHNTPATWGHVCLERVQKRLLDHTGQGPSSQPKK
jgi:hypothetical protein